MYSEKIHKRRILVCSLLMTGLLGVVAARLWRIQVREADRYRGWADVQYRGFVEGQAPRGRILDRNGVLLAGAKSLPTVVGFPEKFETEEDARITAWRLSEILGVNRFGLYKRLKGDRKLVFLKRKVDEETRRAVEEAELPGIGFKYEPGRTYPNGPLAAHIIGFCQMDNNGAAGMEAKLNGILEGKKYRYEVTFDARRRILETWDVNSAEPHRGMDVVLTIDSVLQYAVEEALNRKCLELDAVGGSAVVLEVGSGEILACANYPTFDPNRYNEVRNENDLANRAVAHLYEPGSVQKVATLLAGISERVVRPDTLIHVGNGTYYVAGHTYRDDHPWKPNLTVSEIMMVSSNVGAIKVAGMVGEERFLACLKRYGFADKPCADIPGTQKMYFSTPDLVLKRGGKDYKPWSRLSMPSMAFGGAEVMASAMGMAAFINAVANDGVFVEPHVIKARRSPVGEIEEPFADFERREIAPAWAAHQIRDMMRLVTEEQKGTGKRARIPGVATAGKTGTVRKWDSDLKAYSSRKIISSFGGFFPAEDPQFSVFVVVDEPNPDGDTYGGLVAAPVFQEIGEFCAVHYGIPRDLGDDWKDEALFAKAPEPPVEEQPPAPGRMPLLLGMTAGEACSILFEQDIVPRITGSGVVIWQDPPKGAPTDLRPVELRLGIPIDESNEITGNRRT